MSAESYLSGHRIAWSEEEQQWIFQDTKEPTASTYRNRPCGKCGMYPTLEGHDACLGVLPGVMNACCGHGQLNQAYVQYSYCVVLRGESAIQEIEKLKNEANKK